MTTAPVNITDRALSKRAPSDRPVPAILVGGVVVGVVDLAYAILVYSPRRPILIPQHIASGVLGMKSFSGGTASAALGVVLHFVISIGAAAVYYVASRKLRFLVHRPVTCGLVYGAAVYLVMHFVIIPLSAAAPSGLPLTYKVVEFFEHWVAVGLPIALSVRRYAPGRKEV